MGEDSRRFAVLEHRWDGVHWDFLVEDGPTLRTWAIAGTFCVLTSDSLLRSGKGAAFPPLPPFHPAQSFVACKTLQHLLHTQHE